jgi:hypothetical protein
MYKQKGIDFGVGTGNGNPKKPKSSSKGTGLRNLKGGKGKSSFDLKGYLKGEQGYIPDYKGKSTRQAANESTFWNPKGSKERLADQMDTKEKVRLRGEQIARDKAGKKTSKAEAAHLKSYLDKNKKVRPNRKDRY